jgi:hypothetical protein
MRVLTSATVALVLVLPVPTLAGLLFAALTVAHGIGWTRSAYPSSLASSSGDQRP